MRYIPLIASSFIELPKEITRKKACLNIVNRDEKCFMWSVLAALHLLDCNQNANRVMKYTPFENKLVFMGITFPMMIKDITKFEKLNLTISVNVFGYEESDIFPLRITDEVKF